MEPACSLVPSPDSFASGLLAFLDCQAATLGAQGYAALAAPGSSASLLLTSLLTILIALLGYRMLLGETPSLREGVLTFVKIGVVLALATGWPAYQVLIYDVALRTPSELATDIGGAAGLPGMAGDLASRLDAVDQGFWRLAILGVGIPVIDAASQASATEPPLWAGFDTFALGASRVLFLGTAIGGFALVRLAAGLLLALGPIFVGFLLFDGTRGLFEGWLRGLIATMLGALATAILLGVELALLEGWLEQLLVQRASGLSIAGVPAALFATAAIFVVTLAGLLFFMVGAVSRLRLPHRLAIWQPAATTAAPVISVAGGTAVAGNQVIMSDNRSRAISIADSISTSQRREEQAITQGATLQASQSILNQTAAAGTAQVQRVGQPLARRTAMRVSRSAGFRDSGR